jgi:hypothetical protein
MHQWSPNVFFFNDQKNEKNLKKPFGSYFMVFFTDVGGKASIGHLILHLDSLKQKKIKLTVF